MTKKSGFRRFSLHIDTAGGFWTAMWSNDWNEILKKSKEYPNDKFMWADDMEYGLSYHFFKNKWTKVGCSPKE